MNRVKLGKLLKIQHGFAFKKENYVEKSKYVLVTLANISETNNFQFSPDKATYYGGKFPKTFFLNENDLIMPLTEQVVGLFGNSAFVPKVANIQFVLNQRVGKVIPYEEKIDKYYLHYLLATKTVREQLEYRASGTRQRNISPDDVYDVIVDIPDIETQKKIGYILYRLENKINLNKKINAVLQQMARTAYMHSFFNKKPNGVLGEVIIENPTSSIPVGDAKKSDGDIPFFTSGDAVLKWPDSLVDGRNCFLNTGGNAGIKFYVGDAAYSTDTWCITAKDNLADYMYLFIESIKAELYQKFFQGTGLKHLQKPLLKKRQIYIPTQTEIDNFNVKVQSWLTMVSENIQEINTLMNLRDWLLPMLMNGQIKVI